VPEGKDRKGRPLKDLSVQEYERYQQNEARIHTLQRESRLFREKLHEKDFDFNSPKDILDPSKEQQPRKGDGVDLEWIAAESKRPLTWQDIQEEKDRRQELSKLSTGKMAGKYSGDPAWDDVMPIPQIEGENALAAISYSDDYAEAVSYLRAVMAANEHSERVLGLAEDVIDMNPGHYTVWLYRAHTILALGKNIEDELAWTNEVALQNQKNYQIWHHRQLLIDSLYPTIENDRAKQLKLGQSEIRFLEEMFDQDKKNYHVWSYRQYLVRKLDLWSSATEGSEEVNELESLEKRVEEDVRNNSAWSQRFFLVFSDPAYTTPGARATEKDDKIPADIIEREIKYAQDAIRKAPQNQSPWNYLRGVLKKAGREMSTVEGFAKEFVQLGGPSEESVKSSHALDLLAEVWGAAGDKQNAQKAFSLLSEKYDPVRKNYWAWRSAALGVGAA
jgi:protein farnesyltransferase/geranylgeranyltransferase type-1 subunit alpha